MAQLKKTIIDVKCIADHVWLWWSEIATSLNGKERTYMYIYSNGINYFIVNLTDFDGFYLFGINLGDLIFLFLLYRYVCSIQNK